MIGPDTSDRDMPRDAVTGLPTIETVRGRLEDWLARAADGGEPARVHALLLGLRRFDAVNLVYGASTGDQALAEVAARICHLAEDELDGPWLVARGSGGNFLLAANEACSRERWQMFAAQLADLVAQPIPAAAGALRTSCRKRSSRSRSRVEMSTIAMPSRPIAASRSSTRVRLGR